MVIIFIDPIYAGSMWCENLKQSLVAELKKKRIRFSFCEELSAVSEKDTIFLIASDHAWTEHTIRRLNSRNIQPILICNQLDVIDALNYSCVCSDIYGSMKNIFALLKNSGKKHPAIYGINESSMSDSSRLVCIENLSQEFLFPYRTFYNHGSLSDCFEQFFAKIENYDSVICANDFAAISFIKHLEERAPEKRNELLIFSCAKSELSELYRGRIISPKTNYHDFGKAAVYISEKSNKHPFISNMVIRIASPIDTKDTTTIAPEYKVAEISTTTDEFYQDAEIVEMIAMEKLLCRCDHVDKQIINFLLQKRNYDEIGELCFLSESSVKYRIRRIIEDCGFESKDEMLRIAKKYTTVS